VCKYCANLKSNKPRDQKAFNITLSEIDEEVLDENANYLAFAMLYDFDFKQSDV
jgi:pyruvate-formate lyase-activating enzyme